MIFSCWVWLTLSFLQFSSLLMEDISFQSLWNGLNVVQVIFFAYLESKLSMNQMQHNAYQTNMEFEIGYEYVYVVHLYLFVCFFVSLQPIVCMFAVFGYLLMFWAQKWALFNRMRRPIPGNDLINTALAQLVFLGPIIYSLGSLTWVNFFPEGTPKYALLPNLIALGISLLMWILPLSLIFSCCLKEK